MGYGLDFHHLQHSKVGLPLVEPIQRIVVRAEILGQRLPLNRSPEHPAQRRPIDRSAVNAKPDDATCELVHNPAPNASVAQRFTTKQVDAPQTVLNWPICAHSTVMSPRVLIDRRSPDRNRVDTWIVTAGKAAGG